MIEVKFTVSKLYDKGQFTMFPEYMEDQVRLHEIDCIHPMGSLELVPKEQHPYLKVGATGVIVKENEEIVKIMLNPPVKPKAFHK